MNKVTKVSIGGIAFTLDDDAYTLIEEYISKLNAHYSGHPNGKEIVEAIEERLAELFIDRGGKTGVISVSMATEVIGRVGSPEEIFGEPENNAEEPRQIRKRLYRHPSDKMIAGVFGGIGAYFHIDPSWCRLGFAAMFILLATINNFHWPSPFLLILVYAVLWICVPLARTTEQKCAMRGGKLSYDDIEKHLENRKEYEDGRNGNNAFWAFTGKALLIIIGIFLIFIALAGFIGILATVFGIVASGATVVPDFINDLLMSSEISFTATSLLLMLVIALPLIGMLYGGILLVFKLKSPAWRPGLIIFLLWMASLVGLIVLGVDNVKHLLYHEKELTTSYIEPQGETIHIEFEGIDNWAQKQVIVKGDEDEFSLIYLDKEMKDSTVAAVYPRIELNRNGQDSCSVSISSNLFNALMSLDELKKKQKLDFYSFHGDTLTLSPVLYGKGRTIGEIGRKVVINLPETMRVVIDRPIFHQFDHSVEYSNMDISEEVIETLEKTTDDLDIDFDFDAFKNK